MTEREKMLAGLLYDCGDEELLGQWHRAKDLVRAYNLTDSADREEKERILKELLGGKGKNLWITPPLIAPNVQIYTAFHPTNAFDRFGEPKEDGSFEFCKTRTAPVTIGDHVWIGGGAIILPGVTIGHNVVIGAGSVVTGDIPGNTIVYGNPCRVRRENRADTLQKEDRASCLQE